MATFESWSISSSEVELASRVPIIQMTGGDLNSTVYNMSFKVPIMLSSTATLSQYWYKVVLFTHPFNTSNWAEDETTISGVYYWYYRRTGSSSTRMSATQYKDAITNSAKGGSGTILYDSKWRKSDVMYENDSDAIAHPLTISLDFTDGGDRTTGSYTSGIPASNFSQGVCVAFICTTDTDPNTSAPTDTGGYNLFEMPSNQKIYNVTGLTSADRYTITYSGSNQSEYTNWPSNTSVTAGNSFTIPSTIPYRRYNYTYKSITLNYNYSGSTNETKSIIYYNQDRVNKWKDQSGTLYERGKTYKPTKNLTLQPDQASGWFGESITSGFTLPTPTHAGWNFKGWYTATSGGTKVGNGGEVYSNNSYSTIYAQWTYTVSYNDTDGWANIPATQTANVGNSLVLSSTIPTKSNDNYIYYTTTLVYNNGNPNTTKTTYSCYSHTFKQWMNNTIISSATLFLNPGDTYNEQVNITFYPRDNPKQIYTTFKLPIPENPIGKTFSYWGDEAGNKLKTITNSADGSLSYCPEANGSIYAYYSTNTCTVSYDANGGSNAPASLTVDYNTKINLGDPATRSSSSSITTTFNSRGSVYSTKNSTSTTTYPFTGWHLNSPSGEVYPQGALYTVTADTTFYASWGISSTNITAVTFPANPSNYNTTTTNACSVILNANYSGGTNTTKTADLTTTYTFKNWNTNSNGTGTSYTSSSTYKPTSNSTLYAQWNSSSSGTITVTAEDAPARTGYTFLGWSESASGTNTSLEKTLTYSDASSKTLYAQWEIVHYIIDYNLNGGSGTTPSNQTKDYGATITLKTTDGITPKPNSSVNGYVITLNNDGETSSIRLTDTIIYAVNGWNTQANGNGISFASGASYSINSNMTMYVNWSSSTIKGTATLPIPEKEGYIFDGWYTSAEGGTRRNSGYTPTSNETLYAHWTPENYITTINYYTSTNDYTSSKVYYYDGSTFIPISVVHYYNGTNWITVGTQIPYIE